MPELATLEARWKEATTGKSALHLDLRFDNLLIDSDDNVFVVDWASPCTGAQWVDTALYLPTIGRSAQETQTLWDTSPVSKYASDHALDAWLAGYWIEGSTHPPLPQATGLRDHQRRSGEATFRWLEYRGFNLGSSLGEGLLQV